MVHYWHGVFSNASMTKLFFLSLIFFSACTLPGEKKAKEEALKQETTVLQSNDINTASTNNKDIDTLASLPPVQPIKKPVGIYHTTLPFDQKIEQTVVFNKDLTYKLEEKYPDRDSMVITEGNWSPSDGYIWLYKDQIVFARYKWKGDKLQYYSPQLKKSFTMNALQDVLQNDPWKNQAQEGIIVYGIGNEPFWRIEYNNRDTISFLMADWEHPVKMKMTSSFSTKDSTGYLAQNDSAKLHLTVYPYFCNDGMSDLTYRNRIRVQYNQQVYNGCGMMYSK